MKNILIVSPYFYPYAGVGANRMTALVKFLMRDFNITVMKESNENYDGNIIENDDEIFRNIKTIECNKRGNFFVKRKEYINKIKNYLKYNKPKYIIISLGPFYTFSMVDKIKKYSKDTKVILDIRDFWALEPVGEEFKNPISNKIKSFIKFYGFEKRAVEKADHIVLMGEEEKEYLRRYYEHKYIDTMTVIQNGFDKEKLIGVSEETNVHKLDDFNIVCYGKFSDYLSKRQLDEFVKSLNFNEKIRFIHIGKYEESIAEACRAFGVEYINKGYMEYRQGISFIIENARLCVISMDLGLLGLGTKVFDYIFCNKPILYIGSEKDAIYKYISKFKNAYVGNSYEDFIKIFSVIDEDQIYELDDNIDKFEYSRQYHFIKYKKLMS